MARIYEGMYLLDNAVVRENWNTAKSIITGTLEKHGGKVITARRWGERRLAYPIKRRNRATFLLSYFEIPAESIPAMRRDFELNESVLRALELAVEAVPEGEMESHEAELAADFTVPPPPDDDHVDLPDRGDDDRRSSDSSPDDRDQKTSDDDVSDEDSEDDEEEVVKASKED